MRGEMPVFTRCCLCVPLRHGLIVWGYIRLVLDFILLVAASKGFHDILLMAKTEPEYIYHKINAVMLGLFLILTLADIALTIAFVIGGHKKNLKLFRIYYIYNLIFWVLMILLGVALIAYSAYLIKRHELDLFHIVLVVIDVATYLSQILIQAYFLLLVRSEIKKLTLKCEFRFVNNAAESACNMKCEEDAAAGGDKEDNNDTYKFIDTDSLQEVRTRGNE